MRTMWQQVMMQPLCEANLSLHACWHDFAVLVSVTFSLIHSFKDKEDIVICVISRTGSNLFFAFSFIDVQNTSILGYVPEIYINRRHVCIKQRLWARTWSCSSLIGCYYSYHIRELALSLQVCDADGQADWEGQPGVSMDYDMITNNTVLLYQE